MLKINQCISIVSQEGYCESMDVRQLHIAWFYAHCINVLLA